MNSKKALIAGVVGGIVLWLCGFVLHGLIMGSTYMKYKDVFSQEEDPSHMVYFLVLALGIAIVAALIFAKTRGSWGDGVAGGAKYGLMLGLLYFFPQFYNSMIFEGFPYYLNWCWGGIQVIEMVILGIVLALVYKDG